MHAGIWILLALAYLAIGYLCLYLDARIWGSVRDVGAFFGILIWWPVVIILMVLLGLVVILPDKVTEIGRDHHNTQRKE